MRSRRCQSPIHRETRGGGIPVAFSEPSEVSASPEQRRRHGARALPAWPRFVVFGFGAVSIAHTKMFGNSETVRNRNFRHIDLVGITGYRCMILNPVSASYSGLNALI